MVPYRYLFTWEYNKHIDVDESLVKRVESWEDLYHKIKKKEAEIV